MKKLLFALVGLFVIMFPFNSCEKGDECPDQFQKQVHISSITVDLVVDMDPKTSEIVNYTVTKYRCNGTSTDFYGTITTGPLGIGRVNTFLDFNLKNAEDYVEIKVVWNDFQNSEQYFKSYYIYPVDAPNDEVLYVNADIMMHFETY